MGRFPLRFSSLSLLGAVKEGLNSFLKPCLMEIFQAEVVLYLMDCSLPRKWLPGCNIYYKHTHRSINIPFITVLDKLVIKLGLGVGISGKIPLYY